MSSRIPIDCLCAVGSEATSCRTPRRSTWIFPVAELIEYLSGYCVLKPGDVIFTGTPAGVGSASEPRRYLEVGETIESEIEGIGRLSNRCVARS